MGVGVQLRERGFWQNVFPEGTVFWSFDHSPLDLGRKSIKLPSAAITRKYPVESGPALCPNLSLHGMVDARIGWRAKLQGQQLLRLRAHFFADVVAHNDQVLAILGVSTDDDMDMGMFCVPIIYSDPVKTRAEVTLSVGNRSRVKALTSESPAASSGATMNWK